MVSAAKERIEIAVAKASQPPMAHDRQHHECGECRQERDRRGHERVGDPDDVGDVGRHTRTAVAALADHHDAHLRKGHEKESRIFAVAAETRRRLAT